MITGIHALVYSKQSEAIRKFFSDVLGFESVDAGGGWPIFALPPAEVAVHPIEDGPPRHELWLMCDDIDATVAMLRSKGVEVGDVSEQRWGMSTTITLAAGEEFGLYEPRHPTTLP